jgi:hypothetical protein
MHNGEDLLTAKQKADELGKSRATITRWVQSGKLVPAYKDEHNPHNPVMLFHPEKVSS